MCYTKSSVIAADSQKVSAAFLETETTKSGKTFFDLTFYLLLRAGHERAGGQVVILSHFMTK